MFSVLTHHQTGDREWGPFDTREAADQRAYELKATGGFFLVEVVGGDDLTFPRHPGRTDDAPIDAAVAAAPVAEPPVVEVAPVVEIDAAPTGDELMAPAPETNG